MPLEMVPGDVPEEMTRVAAGERVEIASFEREVDAELAAGMLRANGIAAETGKPVIPGLAAELSLWVRKPDATLAKQLLDSAENDQKEA